MYALTKNERTRTDPTCHNILRFPKLGFLCIYLHAGCQQKCNQPTISGMCHCKKTISQVINFSGLGSSKVSLRLCFCVKLQPESTSRFHTEINLSTLKKSPFILFFLLRKKQAALRYMLQPGLQKVLPKDISRLILVMTYFLLTDIYTVVQSNMRTENPKLQGEKGGREKAALSVANRVCCIFI